MGDIYVATTGNDSTGIGSPGNPFATPGKAASVKTTSDKVWIKSGTYTLTSSTANVAGGRISDSTGGSDGVNYSSWEGYASTIGDLGGTIVISAGAVTGINIASLSGNFTQMRNIRLNGNAGSSNQGLVMTAAVQTAYQVWASNCPSVGIDMGGSSQNNIGYCLAETCGTGFVLTTSGNRTGFYIPTGLVARACTGDGIITSLCRGSISYGNGAMGFKILGGIENASFVGCIAAGNTSDGFGTNDGPNNGLIDMCVAVANGGYGFNTSRGSSLFSMLLNCAGYGNTSGLANTYGLGVGLTALGANPFTNSAAGDFSIATLSGAAAAVQAAAFIGSLPGVTTGYTGSFGGGGSSGAGGRKLIGFGGLLL